VIVEGRRIEGVGGLGEGLRRINEGWECEMELKIGVDKGGEYLEKMVNRGGGK
jgi:hypothetical protein